MEAQRDIQHFRGKTQAEFMKWLFQIIIHNCEDLRRYYQTSRGHNPRAARSLDDGKHADQHVDELASHEAAPAEAAIAREEHDLLAGALLKLPIAYRRIIQWRHFDEVSFVEIGNRLGKSDDTVRRMYHFAVHSLGAALPALR
jgi:RNA polymerase sigma-70 factor (ECF subfamily)